MSIIGYGRIIDTALAEQLDRIEAKLDALINIRIAALQEQVAELIEWKRGINQERQ